jgi:hypothetical protein
MGSSDPMDWLPKEMNWRGFGIRLPALTMGIPVIDEMKTILQSLSLRPISLRYVSR